MLLQLRSQEFSEWFAAFRSSVNRLLAGRRVRNALIRGARHAYLTPCKPAFANEAGDLLDFDAWRQAVLAGNPYPKLDEIYGLGRLGIGELITALGEQDNALER